jgi:hypothetical protein
MALSSPGIAILFEHSEWFQPLFAELDRRGISYDRLLAAELSRVQLPARKAQKLAGARSLTTGIGPREALYRMRVLAEE